MTRSILSLFLVSDPDYTSRLKLGGRQPSLVSLEDCSCKRVLVWYLFPSHVTEGMCTQGEVEWEAHTLLQEPCLLVTALPLPCWQLSHCPLSLMTFFFFGRNQTPSS